MAKSRHKSDFFVHIGNAECLSIFHVAYAKNELNRLKIGHFVISGENSTFYNKVSEGNNANHY